MPQHTRPFLKGRLYIQFTVDFPESLSDEQRAQLVAILPPRPQLGLSAMELDNCEETTLHDVNMEEEMQRKAQAAQDAYEEDEGPKVQCAQQ